MARLPKSIIKKYGISKKAWRVFKSKKRGGSRTRKRATRRVSIRRGASKVARRKVRRSRRRSSMSPLMNQVMGAAGVVLYEGFVSPRIPVSGLAKNAVEFGIGTFLAKRGGFLGSTGKALMTVNAVEVVRGLLGGATMTQTATVENF